jgi:cell division protease FtsH
MPDHDPVYKVSIIPRGRALGVTMFLPEEDRYSLSRQSIKSQICSLFGGRIAEEMILGPDYVTTGASNDIERATRLARSMVTKWGLSDRMGPIMYDEDDGEVFLGMSAGVKPKPVSDETAKEIDEEVRRIVDECYESAERMLEENKDKLHLMAQALVELETINSEQIDDIMAGARPREPGSTPPGSGEGTDKGHGHPQYHPGFVRRRRPLLSAGPGPRPFGGEGCCHDRSRSRPAGYWR